MRREAAEELEKEEEENGESEREEKEREEEREREKLCIEKRRRQAGVKGLPLSRFH